MIVFPADFWSFIFVLVRLFSVMLLIIPIMCKNSSFGTCINIDLGHHDHNCAGHVYTVHPPVQKVSMQKLHSLQGRKSVTG